MLEATLVTTHSQGFQLSSVAGNLQDLTWSATGCQMHWHRPVQPHGWSHSDDKELMKKGSGASDYRSAGWWHSNGLTTNVWSKGACAMIAVPCPSLIHAYNQHICGMLVHKLYKTPAKSRRLFGYIFGLCISISWLVHRRDCTLLTKKPIWEVSFGILPSSLLGPHSAHVCHQCSVVHVNMTEPHSDYSTLISLPGYDCLCVLLWNCSNTLSPARTNGHVVFSLQFLIAGNRDEILAPSPESRTSCHYSTSSLQGNSFFIYYSLP